MAVRRWEAKSAPEAVRDTAVDDAAGGGGGGGGGAKRERISAMRASTAAIPSMFPTIGARPADLSDTKVNPE
jgi:hypothetical protein